MTPIKPFRDLRAFETVYAQFMLIGTFSNRISTNGYSSAAFDETTKVNEKNRIESDWNLDENPLISHWKE